jgi:hypothetical protein
MQDQNESDGAEQNGATVTHMENNVTCNGSLLGPLVRPMMVHIIFFFHPLFSLLFAALFSYRIDFIPMSIILEQGFIGARKQGLVPSMLQP